MWGGHTGPGGKTIIPQAGAREAVVPAGRRPGARGCRGGAAAVRGAPTPPGHRGHGDARRPGVRPSSSPVDLPAVRGGRRAMERAFGREVLFTKEGGSGPEADLADILERAAGVRGRRA